VHAVDTLESDSSLAVDNSFIEGDSQDLPGFATAPWKSQSSVNLQQVLASPLFTTHVSTVVQRELEPTAKSVHIVETAVRDNSTALASLVTTVRTLTQSVETLQQSMSATQTSVTELNSIILTLAPSISTSTTGQQGEGTATTSADTTEHVGARGDSGTTATLSDSGGVQATESTPAEPLNSGGERQTSILPKPLQILPTPLRIRSLPITPLTSIWDGIINRMGDVLCAEAMIQLMRNVSAEMVSSW
jgi:hypothetical protein